MIFSFDWHHIRATLRFERHYEYFTITTTLDLSTFRNPKTGNLASAVDRARKRSSVYKEVCEDFEILNLKISSTQISDPYKREEARDDFAPLHQRLYVQHWENFKRDVLCSSRPLSKRSRFPDKSTIEDFIPDIGVIFSDFRGLVLQDPQVDNTTEDESQNLIRTPAWRAPPIRHNFSQPTALPNERVAHVLESLWPFLTCLKRPRLKNYEFTVSRMLRGRALYVTALGVQPSLYLAELESGHPDLLPLFYTLYIARSSQWQIGRLVDHIHHLGTVRIAGIQELPALRAASRRVRTLSQNVDVAVQHIQVTGAKAPEISPEMRTGGYGDWRDMISSDAQLRISFERIADVQTELSGLSAHFLGGLMYRVERSRYYVKQFRDGIQALRIQRVEGFQPYDVFVERRLGATYDFIDRMGRRYERLETHLNLAYQYFLTNGAIRQTRRIAHIQAMAELLFFLIPAPYYLIGIVEHIIEPATAGSILHDYNWLKSGIFALILCVRAVFGLHRFGKLRRDDS